MKFENFKRASELVDNIKYNEEIIELLSDKINEPFINITAGKDGASIIKVSTSIKSTFKYKALLFNLNANLIKAYQYDIDIYKSELEIL